ncbi:anthrax toxin lethal factor-related metalloendopeptidase [Anoxybacteroides tepidamans]|uniref:anthrax toxin lethal factor-related metalloendopeptidase n=1 Tax=Anoxybacteroides tepidamans TaxID=265948 RepID=UPI000486FDC2|nr:toxin [Anoxybacillus tepidamans]
MKRFISLITLVIAVIPLLSFAPYPNTHGVLLRASSLSVTDVPSHSILQDIVILPDQPFDHSEAKKMIERLAHIDPPLLKQIAHKQIYIKLFTGKLTDEPSVRYLRGQTPRGYMPLATWDDVPGIGGSHLVLAKIGYSDKGKGHGSINLELHELAHSVDYIVFGHVHAKPAFLAIWHKEAAQLFPHQYYFLNYPEEYFAESFAYYYYNDETRAHLKDAAPKTYEFIQQLTKRTRK